MIKEFWEIDILSIAKNHKNVTKRNNDNLQGYKVFKKKAGENQT